MKTSAVSNLLRFHDRPSKQRRFAVVAMAATVCVIASLVAAPNLLGAMGAGLALCMVAIAAIDGRRYIIPDSLTTAAFVLGLFHAAFAGQGLPLDLLGDALIRAGVTAVVLFVFMKLYRMVRSADGLGLGDVKLAAVAGVWLDWMSIIGVIEVAAVAALCVTFAIGQRRNRILRWRSVVPFGLYFAPAIWIGWLAETALHW